MFGDVFIAQFPFTSDAVSKPRPVLVLFDLHADVLGVAFDGALLLELWRRAGSRSLCPPRASVIVEGMEPRATVVRAADGHERVVLELADFQALIDAAAVAQHGLPEVDLLVRRLRALLDAPPDTSRDLDEFLAEYDALHGPR